MNELATFEASSVDGYATRIAACWRDSVEAIITAGRLIAEARTTLSKDDYKALIRDRLPFEKRTAERLIAIAADTRIATHVSLLPPSWGTMYELTRLDNDTFDAKIADGTIRPGLERNEITPLIGKRTADTRRALAEVLSDATALSPTGRKFAALYADPAWRRKAGIGNRAYENQYPTMAWEELLAMPVKDRLLPDAQGYIWIPRAHLLALIEIDYPTSRGIAKVKMPLAWAIAYAWGFDSYSTCCVWTKTDEENPDDHGLGLVFWDQDELLLVFKRGRGLPKPDTDKKYGSNHRERADKHSAKPAFYRQMINDMTGGLPVIELFAREDDEQPLPENFFTWGNESRNTAEMPEPIDAAGTPLAHDEVGEIIDTPNRENALTPATAEALPELNRHNCLDVEVPHDEMLEVPAFLLRRPDNSIPSVSVASPRATRLADAEGGG